MQDDTDAKLREHVARFLSDGVANLVAATLVAHAAKTFAAPVARDIRTRLLGAGVPASEANLLARSAKEFLTATLTAAAEEGIRRERERRAAEALQDAPTVSETVH